MISKSAQELIQKHSIDISKIENDGIIKRSDIESFLNKNSSNNQKKKPVRKLKISENQKNIVIVGAGGHSKMIIDIIRSYEEYNLVGLIDASSFIGKDLAMIDEVMGNPVIGDETLIENLINKGVNHAVNAGFIESSLPRKMFSICLKA